MKPKIQLTPTPYHEVVSLLKSDSLRRVEEPIAAHVNMKILPTESSALINYTQGTMSVSGMSPSDIEKFLVEYRDQLIAYGIRFYQDHAAKDTEEEFPEGEEQDSSETIEVHGLANGFGITIAIHYNFLANRPLKEFHEFLKNRRIPHHTKFAKEVKRVFDETRVG